MGKITPRYVESSRPAEAVFGVVKTPNPPYERTARALRRVGSPRGAGARSRECWEADVGQTHRVASWIASRKANYRLGTSRKEAVIVADASDRGDRANRCARLCACSLEYARKALALSGNPSTKDDGWHQRVFDTTEGTLSCRTAPKGDLLSENRVAALVC